MEELHHYLQNKIKELGGAWIAKNSSYEKDACLNLGFNYKDKRYWDCEYNGSYIEIKKGTSRWFDEIRYSEILMEENDECKTDTITIFLIPSKDKKSIQNIYIVDTKKIIEYMELDKEWAEKLLARYRKFRVKGSKRSLNYQHPMSIKNLKEIVDYAI